MSVIKFCLKCQKEHNKDGNFCSRSCANSRGPRSEEFKRKVREKLVGKKMSPEAILKAVLTKGLTPKSWRPTTFCIKCESDTGEPFRKTCSKECKSELISDLTRLNPRNGGQKRTHRNKIQNINGETFFMESSYEVTLAESLNRNSILWRRPEFFFYIDNKGRKRRYYPDFILPNYNIYLDPKNDYLIKTDIEKSKTSRTRIKF